MMTKVGRNVVRYCSWFAALLIMFFILHNSSQNATESTAASGGLIRYCLDIFYPNFSGLTIYDQNTMIASLQYIVRNLAHFAEYFVLGVCYYLAINTYRIKFWLKPFLCSIIALLFSAGDEYYQTFIPGRAGRISDVIIDLFGSITGIAVVIVIIKLFSFIKKRSVKKMRKRDLMNRLSELVMTVEKLNQELKEQREDNVLLNEKVKELTALLSAEKEKAIICESIQDDSTANGFTVKDAEEIGYNDDEDSFDESEISILDFGAEVIGKITILSAKYCDEITASHSSNSKDLLGLIMGKSELCKNEILTISMGEDSPESQKELINAQVFEAEEYFKSVLQQNV